MDGKAFLPDIVNLKDSEDAAVTHILGDILLKQFQKGTRRISPIREFRECFTVISSLSGETKLVIL